MLDNPETGTALGNNAYKIRLRIKSKGKGKSGGARVISYIEKDLISIVTVQSGKVIVNLLTVYDKSEKESITDAELKELIENLQP
ncbi:MAG TPA: hypothetical protein VGB00_15930 [Pyrinomonadaceae bacterium]